MGRTTALVGSAILHVVAGVVLFALGIARHGTAPEPRVTRYEVELAAPLAIPLPVRATAGGGTQGLAAPTPASTAAAPVKAASARSVQATHAAAPTRSLQNLISGVERASARTSGSDAAGDGGLGGGLGGGHGSGVGLGAGDGIAAHVAKPPELPPPPPPPSLARPPRLIWPVKRGDVPSSDLFVMNVVVDTDGFVDGVELVHGPGGKRDQEALSAIWMFRYEPALDDDGHPISAKIEQHFGVNH